MSEERKPTRQPPQKNLGPDPEREPKRVSSAMGTADENYYICRVCGRKWLHEPGNLGLGGV